MKKNLLFVLSILVFSLSFISCGDDEDNDTDSTNLGTAVCYIDDKKVTQKTNIAISSIHYDKPTTTFPTPEFSMMIMFNDEGENAFFHFEGINLDNLKVGDDLVKLCDDYGYQISYEGNEYWLQSDISWYDEFDSGKGKFIVKELNADKTVIHIEFQDIKVPILKGSLIKPDRSKMIDVKGSMKYTIDF